MTGVRRVGRSRSESGPPHTAVLLPPFAVRTKPIRVILSLCLVFPGLRLVPVSTAAPSSDFASGTTDCGPVALYYLLNLGNLGGRPTELREVKASLPPTNPRGYSLLELREASRRLGLILEGLQLRIKDRSPNRPVLAFMNQNGHGHYVVVRPVGRTGRLVQVLDGQDEPIVIDATVLYAMPGWTGLVLIPTQRSSILWIAASFVAILVVGTGLRCLKEKGKRVL
jgi:hypothetical protein